MVNVPRLVAQVQHHAFPHRLVEFVGVDVAAKHLDALLLVGLQQRRAGEADEQRVGQDGLHRLVQFAGLGAVAFVHEHVEIAVGFEVRRQFRDGGDKIRDGSRIVGFLAAEFVDQRTHQPGRRGVQGGDQVRAASGAVDVFVDALEHLFDLLVQFGAVGDEQHPRIGTVFTQPFGQPHHGQAFAAALGVPDDAALAAADEILGGAQAEVLILPADFFLV